MENKIQLALKIVDFDCSVEEISEHLGIIPTDSNLKGDKVTPRGNNGKIEFTESKHNLWEFRVIIESEVWIQNHIDNFVEKVIKQKKNELQSIGKLAKLEFYVSLDSYNTRDSFHFNKELMKSLSDIGIELDIEFKLNISPARD